VNTVRARVEKRYESPTGYVNRTIGLARPRTPPYGRWTHRIAAPPAARSIACSGAPGSAIADRRGTTTIAVRGRSSHGATRPRGGWANASRCYASVKRSRASRGRGAAPPRSAPRALAPARGRGRRREARPLGGGRRVRRALHRDATSVPPQLAPRDRAPTTRAALNVGRYDAITRRSSSTAPPPSSPKSAPSGGQPGLEAGHVAFLSHSGARQWRRSAKVATSIAHRPIARPAGLRTTVSIACRSCRSCGREGRASGCDVQAGWSG